MRTRYARRTSILEERAHVCTLLGHPKFCPHGNSIPPEECCERNLVEAGRVVFPLSEMSVGQSGKIVHIHTHGEGSIQKLLAMGVLPGFTISLMRARTSDHHRTLRARA